MHKADRVKPYLNVGVAGDSVSNEPMVIIFRWSNFSGRWR